MKDTEKEKKRKIFKEKKWNNQKEKTVRKNKIK